MTLPGNRVLKRSIEDILQENITIYSRETFNRAFPHEKDGFKPVARRILYSMNENNITQFVKVSEVVGNVMGQYHPHGDASIGDAIVKLAQPFYLNYPYVEGQGGFGNIAGDRASSARYIECKLSKFAIDVVTSEIDKTSIDYQPNYNYRKFEPIYLPSKIPLVLVNGSSGIGEAFSVCMSPHNLNDIIDRTIAYIRNPRISLEELVKGLYPDLPTGGEITNGEDIAQFYKTGDSGTIRMRAKVEIDQANSIIRILEIPYETNMAAIKDDITIEITEKENAILSGIINFYEKNGADKDKGDYVLDILCKKDVNLAEILEELFKKTRLQSTRIHSMYVNVGGSLRNVNIKNVMEKWYKTRVNTLQRRMTYEITSFENSYHILEGLYNAYDRMDEIISTIRTSTNKDDAMNKLHKAFKFSIIQAKGICEMPLYKLGNTTKSKLKEDMEHIQKELTRIRKTIADLDSFIIDEMKEIKHKYGRPRKTQIVTSAKKGAISTRIFDYGAILWTQQAIGFFEVPVMIGNGRKILSGLRNIKVSGETVRQEIKGSAPVYKGTNAIIVAYSDGTAARLSIEQFPAYNTWINQDNDPNITTVSSIAPINDSIKFIVVISKDKKIRKIPVDDINSRRPINIGQVESILSVESDQDEVLCMNHKGDYFLDTASSFPTLARNASGVKTNFSDEDKVFAIVLDRVRTTGVVALIKDGDTKYSHCIKHTKLKKIKRTNQYKKLFGAMDKIVGVGLGAVAFASKDPVVVISPQFTAKLSMKYFKPRKDPHILSVDPLGLVILPLNTGDIREEKESATVVLDDAE